MIDVVCFCGNSYSFIGNGGACPRCGELVTMPSASADQTRRLSEPFGHRPRHAGEDERPEERAA
jgi:hypothetical protein